MFLGLRTVIYPAPDLAVSKARCTELLGVEPYFDEPFYVGFSVAGYELALDPGGDPANRPATRPATYWGVSKDGEAFPLRVVVHDAARTVDHLPGHDGDIGATVSSGLRALSALLDRAPTDTLAFTQDERPAAALADLPGGYHDNRPDRPPPGLNLALDTDDADAALARAIAAGVRVVTPVVARPWGQPVDFLRDINGALVEIGTPLGDAAADPAAPVIGR